MEIWQYIVLILVVFGGGGLALLVNAGKKGPLNAVLCFSGSYILGITVLHLLPEVFAGGNLNLGFYVILGFFVQILLINMSQGIEHGHIHTEKILKKSVAIGIMVGLCLHSFIEGLPLGSYTNILHLHDNQGFNNHLFYGVILHKIPAAFALASFFRFAGYSKKLIVLLLSVFASMSPLGAWLSENFLWSEAVRNAIMAFVIGSFLHISTTILLETTNITDHETNFKKILVILAGLGLALLTLLME